jgi:hypothetical protein
MQLIEKIDELIKFGNFRIDYIKIKSIKNNCKDADGDIWSAGYDKGYIAGLQKYIDELTELKNYLIEINKDDDDV